MKYHLTRKLTIDNYDTVVDVAGTTDEDSQGHFAVAIRKGTERLLFSSCVGDLNYVRLFAVVHALEALRQANMNANNVLIVTDSSPVIEGLKNLDEWVRRGWVTSRGTPVQYADVWKRVVELVPMFKRVTWCYQANNTATKELP
jgi:ribonuclease HI